MRFREFAKILQKIETTTSRIEMTNLLAKLFKSLSIDEIAESLYLIQGRVVPRYVALEFNIARKLMVRAIAKAFGKEIKEIEEEFNKLGDLGMVVQSINLNEKSNLTILELYKNLYTLAKLGGKGSVDAKVNKITEILKEADGLSSKYIVRIILGNLRLGVSDKTFLDALSFMKVGNKSKREILDRAYGVRSDIGLVAKILLKDGIGAIENITVTPGIPVASMLCEREKSIENIFNRFGKVAIQPKYDGLRCQIHYNKAGINLGFLNGGEGDSFLQNSLEKTSEKVRLFSRNLEDLSNMFPDINDSIKKYDIDSIVIDSEIVGYDENADVFLPFQETIKRRRKYEVNKMKENIPIRAYIFDILYINGKDILSEKFLDRFEIIKKVFSKKVSDNIFFITPTDILSDANKGIELFTKYIEQGLEGIVVKNPNSRYMPGKRGFEWIKYKRASESNLADTIDAVVLGYYYGRGLRAKFGIGALLIGVLNEDTNEYESIAKVGTGITDKQWHLIKKRLDDISLKSKPSIYNVSKQLFCDVWVEPRVVVEVEADEITKSSIHTAGFDAKEGFGFSLRFPRLKIFDRKDKDPDMVTLSSEVRKMFKL